jgi:hypothetical protein
MKSFICSTHNTVYTSNANGLIFDLYFTVYQRFWLYRGTDKSVTWPTSQCILFDGENISFDANLVIYVNSINIPPITIIKRTYET